MPFAEFESYLRARIEHRARRHHRSRACGLAAAAYQRLVERTDSIIHIAASLNRRSERLCLNVNLRGTLEVIEAGARGARPARPAPLQRRVDDGRRRRAQPRGRARGRVDRLGAPRLRSVCAHEEVLRAHGRDAAARRADDGVSAVDRDRRHALRRDHAVRHGACGVHAGADEGCCRCGPTRATTSCPPTT